MKLLIPRIGLPMLAMLTMLLPMLWIAAGQGAEPAKEEAKPAEAPLKQQTISLTIYPAKPPRKALEHRLSFATFDQVEGNAASLYSTAMLLLANEKFKESVEVSNWLDMAPVDLPVEKVESVLSGYSIPLKYVRLAARRSYCRWEIPLREFGNPIAIMLPECQEMRSLSQLVALSARLNIARGKISAAMDDLCTGCAMARHISEQGFLISGMVGIAIGQQMNTQLRALIQAKDAPSLYWPISAFHRPLIDMRSAVETERSALKVLLSGARKGKEVAYSPDDWQKALDELRMLQDMMVLDGDQKESTAKKIITSVTDLAISTTARKSLIERGFDAKQVEAMSVPQAIVVNAVETYEEQADELYKYFYLPYWQGKEQMLAYEKARTRDKASALGLPDIASALLPAVSRIRETMAYQEEQLEGLRLIEALRLYAGTHDGKLPAKLDDLAQTPISNSPLTGKPLVYTSDVEKGTARLVLAGTQSRPSIIYEIKLKK